MNKVYQVIFNNQIEFGQRYSRSAKKLHVLHNRMMLSKDFRGHNYLENTWAQLEVRPAYFNQLNW